jgi:hypothetical protein
MTFLATLALKAMGIWNWLKEALSALFRLAMRYPLQAALIASLCLSGWLWRGRQAARVDAATWEQAYTDQKAAYQSAQAEAASKQLARDLTDLTEQAHAANDTIRKNAVDVYARAHPVRVCRQAADSAPGGPGAAGLPSDPGQPLAPDADADLVAIPRTDLDHLAAKAVRDTEWVNWGEALIAQGRAVRASDLPLPNMPVDR